MLVEVKDTHFIRDTNSMALINNDSSAREEYYAKRAMLTTQKTEINKLNTEINSLRDELGEIKQLLSQLLGNK